MATDVRPDVRPPASKQDAFVEAQLDRASRRIRSLDLSAALLGLAVGVLGYAALMVLLDRLFVLSPGSRRLALFLFVAGAGAYVAVAVVRPLTRRVNPYFAARRLEAALPDSRNSLLNWVDLRDQHLPGALQKAVALRAAQALEDTDVDQVIGGQRRTAYLAAAAGLLVVALGVVLLVVGMRPFVSHLGRAFVPFGGSGPARRTTVEVTQPKGGDASVAVGAPFTVAADVGGWIPPATDPRAPHLLYRAGAGERWRREPLRYDEARRDWAATLEAKDVGNGLRYKVAAGDTETPEYRVSVRASPLIIAFKATYRPRAYTGKGPSVSLERKLKGLGGTKVEVLVGSNRDIAEAKLDLETKDGPPVTLLGEAVPGSTRHVLFRLVLRGSGHYRVRFSTPEGEGYADSEPHEVEVTRDSPPKVKLTVPVGKEVELPANGTLGLEGEASDDQGVESLTLHLEVVGGARLRSRPYRGGDSLALPGGGYPRKVVYADLLDLASLTTESGQPVQLTPGQEVAYWLEARDACDFPGPNVTQSDPPDARPDKRKRVKIKAPLADEKQRQKERQAELAKQKEREKRAEKEQRDQEARSEKEKRDREEANREAESKLAGPNGGKDKEGPKGDASKEGPPKQDGPGAGTGKEDKKTQDKAKELIDKAKGQGKESQAERDGPGAEGNKGEGKGDQGPGKGKDGENKGEKKPGEARGKGGPEKGGEGRGGGKEEGRNEAAAGRPDPGKDQPPKGGEQPGAGKGHGGKEGEAPPKAAQEAGKGRAGDKGKDGGGKPRPLGAPEEKKATAKGRPESAEGAAGRADAGKPREKEALAQKEKQGTGKAGPQEAPRAKGKGGQKEKTGKEEAVACKCRGGDASSPQAGGKGRPAQRKATPREGSPRAEARPGTSSPEPRPEDAKAEDVDRLKDRLEKAADQKAREAAADKLADVEKKARDEKAREAAKKALDDLDRKDREGIPGRPRGGPDKGEGPARAKKGPTGKTGPGEAREGPGKTAPGTGRAGQGPPSARGKPGGKLGPGGAGERARGEWGGGAEARKRHREKALPHRASQIQLEELKNLRKELVRKNLISEEEMQKLLRDLEGLARRQKEQAREKETGKRGKGGHTSVSVGKQRGGRPGDLRSEARPKPPPGYQDGYNEYLRLLEEGPR